MPPPVPPASLVADPIHEAIPVTPVSLSKTPPPLPAPGLEDVLRFDVTVEWVMQHWSRVSTGFQHIQLQGYRIALVTGGELTDIAGSLTYYFNPSQQVQRILFHGTTGDPAALVGILTSRYHFTRRLVNDPGWVIYETVDANNQLTGSLKIRSARVVRADQPYTRFEVELAIDRPDSI
jgi:hypothetical protein